MTISSPANTSFRSSPHVNLRDLLHSPSAILIVVQCEKKSLGGSPPKTDDRSNPLSSRGALWQKMRRNDLQIKSPHCPQYRVFGIQATPSYIRVMPPPLRRFANALLLVVYATSLLLVVSPHGDAETAFGSGWPTIQTHADADNCKHIDSSHAETCSLCSSFAGRALLSHSPFVLESSIQVSKLVQKSASPSVFSVLLDSFTRRGPPLLFA